MFRIHVTLVGGQPAPVYTGIVHTMPDKVIMICSEQTFQEAKRIQQEISIPAEIQIFDPIDLILIEEQTYLLARELVDYSISVNISGGTKPWGYYLTVIFGKLPNAEIFYVDQNNCIWSFKDKKKESLIFRMDSLFRLYGNPLTQYTSFNEFENSDFEAIEQIRRIRRRNNRDFFFLTDAFGRNKDSDSISLNSGSTLKWIDDEESYLFRIYDKFGTLHTTLLHSKNIYNLLINSGWFELEVAYMLSRWSNVEELRLNCIFPDKSNSPKNEIDIIADIGSKLLFVECKTQVKNDTDVDKFKSAVSNYGGSSSKALFVTDAPMKPKTKEKCIDNNVLAFSIVENGGPVNCVKKIIDLLDSEFSHTNPR
ncbi:MAG: hypothetical protein PHX86_06810 [Caldisericia bacterium]|nr:hypothetical protein [Caldisericia bacterium]MDD4428866.1 hypothetical protein [Paludibacter sp.]